MERLRRNHRLAKSSGGRLVVALAAVMAMVFLAGVWMLFQWRFRSGDVYPPGSSLRSDPLGSRAYFESLKELPDFEVSRNTEPYRKLAGGAGRSLFFLGVSLSFLEGNRRLSDLEALRGFVSRGGRLVITINAARPRPLTEEEEEEKEVEREDGAEEMEEGKDKEGASGGKGAEKETTAEAEKGAGKESEGAEIPEERLYGSFDSEWNFNLMRREETRPAEGWKAGKTADLEGIGDADLPSWHSALYFEDPGPDEEWEVLARVEEKPVLVRRFLGEGEIILATDNYFTSNEALARDRSPEFLLWLTGGNRMITFDEAHHGTVLNQNVVQLARRYRLHGFFVGLALFVILLAWRSGSSLLPGDEEIGLGISLRHQVSGQEAVAGFRKLLRRSVRARQLPRTSFETWRHQKSRLSRAYSDDQILSAQQVIAREEAKPRGKADPVAAYREIVKILDERS